MNFLASVAKSGQDSARKLYSRMIHKYIFDVSQLPGIMATLQCNYNEN